MVARETCSDILLGLAITRQVTGLATVVADAATRRTLTTSATIAITVALVVACATKVATSFMLLLLLLCGTGARQMARLVAVVANTLIGGGRALVGLAALTSKVIRRAAAIACVGLVGVLALACKVTGVAALVAATANRGATLSTTIVLVASLALRSNIVVAGRLGALTSKVAGLLATEARLRALRCTAFLGGQRAVASIVARLLASGWDDQ